MVREAFCATCIRTVYRADEDDELCPVCLTVLVIADQMGEMGSGRGPAAVPFVEDKATA